MTESSPDKSGHPDVSGGDAATFDPKLIDRSKPWDGDSPPVPLYGVGSDVKFERRVDGVWCRQRGRGMYPVDRNGEQWVKPKLYKPDGSLNYDLKPPEIHSKIWYDKFNASARKKFWVERWKEHPHLKPPFPRPPDAAPCVSATECAAPGIFGFFEDKLADVTKWTSQDDVEEMMDCPATEDDLEEELEVESNF